MENVYGIGVANRYALFLDEDSDPLDILKQSEAEQKVAKAKKIEDATKPVAKGPAVKKEAANTRNEADKENQRNRQFEGKRVVDARKAGPGGEPREERNNQRNTEYRRDDDGGRDGGRGRGRGRGEMRGRGRGGEGGGRGGGRGGGEGGRGGKRDFDRKSGDNRTGIKAEDKRGGGGKGNWGTFEDDVPKEGEEANTTVDSEGKDEAATEEEPKAPRELTAEELEAKAAREEEEKQMTLDQWKAMQAKKEGPKFNVRKAGEGSDVDPKWKKATAYKKENEEENDEEEEEAVIYLQRSTRQKKLDINFTFADQGGRGGGDRGRGGRGRGEGRGRGGRECGGMMPKAWGRLGYGREVSVDLANKSADEVYLAIAGLESS